MTVVAAPARHLVAMMWAIDYSLEFALAMASARQQNTESVSDSRGRCKRGNSQILLFHKKLT